MAKRKGLPPQPQPQPPPAVASILDEADRRAAAAALRKAQAGEKLSASDRAAIRRFEQAREESQRWTFYRTIPQKHWREMSGRQAKIINEQAVRYGIPFSGRSVDLPAVVRALHDFLAANALKLNSPDTDDPLLAGASSPALEEYRREKTKIARLDRLERERSLIPRDELHDLLARAASLIRSAGESLERQHGKDAHALLDEALDDVDREITSFFARFDADHAADDGDNDIESPT